MCDSPDNPDGLPWQTEADAPSVAELEEAGQESIFGVTPTSGTGAQPVPEPAGADRADSEAPKAAPAQPYRVLARKYRPQTFAELIGQEAMVRTLANAIARDRLAHAFFLEVLAGESALEAVLGELRTAGHEVSAG